MIAEYCQNCAEKYRIYEDWYEGEQLPLRSYIKCQFCGGCAYINRASVRGSVELMEKAGVINKEIIGATDI